MPRRDKSHSHRTRGEAVHTDPRREAQYVRELINQGYRQGHAKATAKIWAGNQPQPDTGRALPSSVSEGMDDEFGDIEASYFPTPSINPQDPRTSAAGYDYHTQRMRVWWGDGKVPYDYHDITPQEWDSFQKAPSPGRWINMIGNAHEYGPVDS